MDALSIRMEIKALIQEARKNYPDFNVLGTVDEEDVVIEALIHPELFDLKVRLKEDYL